MNLILAAIAAYLDSYLGSARFPHDQNGMYRPSQCNIQRIGLALEPWADIGVWTRQEQLDALFLHRPWHLERSMLPDDVGVLAYHLAFDLSLTCSFNPRLADILHMRDITPFAFKDAVPLEMLGDIAPTPLDSMMADLTEIFGKPPLIEGTEMDTIQCIAVVGAMTDTLVRTAAAQGVQPYITGQLRRAAQSAVHETGMIVAEIGHATSEWWGLHALASLLREHWPNLEVVLAPRHTGSITSH